MAAPPRPELVAAMSDAAAAVGLVPIEVELDQVATYNGKPGRLPVVLRGDSGVAALSQLHAALEARIERFVLARRACSRFTPHLTLFYGERPVGHRAVPAIGWHAREFVLIHGQTSPRRHDVLGRWPLRG